MFHIGVLAPGLEGAAEMLRRLDSGDRSRGAARQRPELTLSWAPLGAGSAPWQRGDRDHVRTQLALGIARLKEAGAHFFVCPDDTAYAALDDHGADLSLPGVHVASVVAAEAQRQGFATVGILGTRWTLSCERYVDELEPRGIGAVPLPVADQTTLHSIIFDELVRGRSSLRSRDRVLEMIDWFASHGCQAVVLSCSELGVLVSPSSASLPILDATAMLADAAVAVAVGDAQLPEWRGGPHLVTR